MKIIYRDGTVAECPKEEELDVLRHSAAHIMAQAIKRLYPHADFGYGPSTEKGFYYDVDLGDTKLTDEDLQKIEAEMKKIIKENLPIKPFILPRSEAIALMEQRGAKYKVEHIGDLAEDEIISFYQQGDYIDMCTGPHLCYTKALKAFRITQQSGAYWKNDKKNKMLTRINGVAFRTQEELDEYVKLLEEAERRDHRKIGKEMNLFMFSDVFYLKGTYSLTLPEISILDLSLFPFYFYIGFLALILLGIDHKFREIYKKKYKKERSV